MIKIQMFAFAAVFAACAVLSACSSDTKNLIGDKIGSLDASSLSGMASGDSSRAKRSIRAATRPATRSISNLTTISSRRNCITARTGSA